MRKEVIWAIVAGIVLGLIIAFGVFRINSAPTTKKVVVNQNQPTVVPSATTGPTEFKVVLDKPLQNDVVIQNSVTVSGLTKALSWTVVSGENGDYIVQADTSGAFSQDVDLIPGVNHIQATSFDASGSSNTAKILVVYSSSFELRTATSASPSASASDSSSIRQKVAQDLENTLSRPKAYIGIVTDVTDSTIETKATTGAIEQMSISETTNVINAVGTVNKQVKTTDIAIGDYIIAMGYVGTNSVLSAQRILITNPVIEPKIFASIARVASVTKKTLTVDSIDGNTEDTLTPDSKTIIASYRDGKVAAAKFSAITSDTSLVYVTTTDSKNVSKIRSIFILPQN